MYKITLCLVILKLHTTTSQFPNHVDLQKVGEIIFNNEKHNILKPTTHVITDYFKEYMLSSKSKLIPTKRVFIDDNGFRHSWSGFDDKIVSLRKTDVNVEENNQAQKENVADKNNNDTPPENTVETNTEVTEATTEKTTFHWSYFEPVKKVDTNLKEGVKNTDTKKDKDAGKDVISAPVVRSGANKTATRGGKGDKTLAKVTFFCPYMGIMTMSAFVD